LWPLLFNFMAAGVQLNGRGVFNSMDICRSQSDYMNDDTQVSPADRERINFEVALIGKMIEAREQKGFSQRELAEMAL
jgi:hypothetical protein